MASRISDVYDQKSLTSTLITLRTAAVYDLFAQTLLHNFYKEVAAGKADLSSLVADLPEGKLTLKHFTDHLTAGDERALVETKRNANRALTKNLFRETFRITEAYCRNSNQLDTLKENTWFEFARIVANCLSHNSRLDFRPYDLQRLPVSYKGAIIDSSMDGQGISLQLEILINLVDELISYSKKTE